MTMRTPFDDGAWFGLDHEQRVEIRKHYRWLRESHYDIDGARFAVNRLIAAVANYNRIAAR